MQVLTAALGIVCLSMIAYQDLTSRRVEWIYFPLLAIAGLLHSFTGLHTWKQVFFYTGCNLGFLAVQFILLGAWFLIRGTALTQIVDKKIGWGDVLFLVAAGCFFSPVNFISFYISGLVISLAVAVLWMGIKRSTALSIPLAGLQSMLLLMLLCTAAVLHFSFLSDRWLMDKIIRP